MNPAQYLSKSSFTERCQRWLGAKSKTLAALAISGMLLILLVAGCETPNESPAPQFARLTSPVHMTVLDQGDVISINFRYSTNFDTVQKIGLDGMVNLEGVGQVKAEGKTVEQLQDELTTLYKAQVKDDPITVKISGATASVYVTGAVNRPGKIIMDRRMTVMDAIAEAGGFDQYHARLSRVSILRVDGDTQKVYWVDLNRVLNGQDFTPFYLKPFDVINVPTKTFNF